MVLRPLHTLPPRANAALADAWLEKLGAALADPKCDRALLCRQTLVEMAYQNTGYRRVKNPRIWSMHDLHVLVGGVR